MSRPDYSVLVGHLVVVRQGNASWGPATLVAIEADHYVVTFGAERREVPVRLTRLDRY